MRNSLTNVKNREERNHCSTPHLLLLPAPPPGRGHLSQQEGEPSREFPALHQGGDWWTMWFGISYFKTLNKWNCIICILYLLLNILYLPVRLTVVVIGVSGMCSCRFWVAPVSWNTTIIHQFCSRWTLRCFQWVSLGFVSTGGMWPMGIFVVWLL